MRTINACAKSENIFAKGLLLLASASLFISCTPSGNISSSSAALISGAVTLTNIYPPSVGPTWTPISAGGRLYVKGLSLAVTGTCTRGIATIAVNEGGANYPETSTCNDDGTFTWSKTYTAVTGEGDKTLNFVGVGVDGSTPVTGATIVQTVRIDNTAPALPTFTTPGSSPFNFTGSSATFTIIGNCSADTLNITGPGGVTITPTGTTWSYVAALVDGASTDYTFYANDLAGNTSAGQTQTIVFSPSINFVLGGTLSGGAVAGTSTSQGEMSISNFSGQSAMTGTNDGTETAQTGFNYIINQSRVRTN